MRYTIQNHHFELNAHQAEVALAAKQVIGGHDTGDFDLFPVKYAWALEKYGTMMANHWEPDDIQMQKDIEQWQSSEVTETERWIIRMGIGYFSAAEGIVGDNIQHVVRDLVTAPELKMMLGRHAHEENIHADSLLYMISSLGINPHECEAMFEQIPTIVRKNEFVTRHSRGLRRGLDLTQLENQRLLAKNLFVFGQCMEGTQFFGLFAMILSLKRYGKFNGIGEMFEYTLRDETNHIEIFRRLFLELLAENPAIATRAFQDELVTTMQEAVAMEKEFIRDCLPSGAVGLRREDAELYIDFIADCRLKGCGLPVLNPGLADPLPWLDESIRLLKEKNFFETRITSYQKVASFISELFKPEKEGVLPENSLRDLRVSVWQAANRDARSPERAATELKTCDDATQMAGNAFSGAVIEQATPLKGQEITYQIGKHVFRLDRSKAEAAYAAKRVINGRESLTFNLLPLRYEWAYDFYKKMKQAHWGPLSADIQMNLDAEQWHSGTLSTEEKGMVALSLGWLASLPRLPGAALQHSIRMHVTAPELKLVLGREPQDANTRLEALLFAAQVFELDLHDCEAHFKKVAKLSERHEWLRPHEQAFMECQDVMSDAAQKTFGRAVFLAGSCLKGLAFASLHWIMADLAAQGKCPGLGRMMSKICADEASYLDVFEHLLSEARKENPVLSTQLFRDELLVLMNPLLELEKAFLRQLKLETKMSETLFCELDEQLGKLSNKLHTRLWQLNPGRDVITLCADDKL